MCFKFNSYFNLSNLIYVHWLKLLKTLCFAQMCTKSICISSCLIFLYPYYRNIEHVLKSITIAIVKDIYNSVDKGSTLQTTLFWEPCEVEFSCYENFESLREKPGQENQLLICTASMSSIAREISNPLP